MRRREWPLIAVAFGGLVCLMVIAGTVFYRHWGAVQAQIDRITLSELLKPLATARPGEGGEKMPATP